MALQSLDQVLKSTQVSSLLVVANTATKGLLQEMAGVLGVGTAVTKSCHEFQLFNKLCLTGLSGVAYVAVYCYLALFCKGHNSQCEKEEHRTHNQKPSTSSAGSATLGDTS